MSETFQGYRFLEKGGRYYAPVRLEGAEQAFAFVKTFMEHYPELRMTDSSDTIVVQALDGKTVFPAEWVGIGNRAEQA